MALKEQIEKDLLTALKNKENRLSILRMLKSALQNALVEKRGRVGKVDTALDEKETLEVVRRQVKQLKDALVDFEKGGRTDLADQARAELKVLEAYLPAQMSAEELEKAVIAVIQETGAQGSADAGKVMGQVMKRLAGAADGTTVKEIVNRKLS